MKLGSHIHARSTCVLSACAKLGALDDAGLATDMVARHAEPACPASVTGLHFMVCFKQIPVCVCVFEGFAGETFNFNK